MVVVEPPKGISLGCNDSDDDARARPIATLDFLEPLENSDFPNIEMLSGLSALIDMLDIDFFDVWRRSVGGPGEGGPDRCPSDPKDETVLLVLVLP